MTEQTPKVTEQTKNHILPCFFVMMYLQRRNTIYAGNRNNGT